MAAASTLDLAGEPARILRFVLAREGAHFREIQRGLGLSTGQADHHLRRLVNAGLLARTRLGGEVHYFAPTRPRTERRPLAALQQPARRAVAATLADLGPVPLRPLREATRMPESTLLHHLRVLVRAGVAYRVAERGRVAYGLSDPRQVLRLLAPRGVSGRGARPRPPA